MRRLKSGALCDDGSWSLGSGAGITEEKSGSAIVSHNFIYIVQSVSHINRIVPVLSSSCWPSICVCQANRFLWRGIHATACMT